MPVGEPEIPTGMVVGESLVIEAETLQHRRLGVMHVNWILGNAEKLLTSMGPCYVC